MKKALHFGSAVVSIRRRASEHPTGLADHTIIFLTPSSAGSSGDGYWQSPEPAASVTTVIMSSEDLTSLIEALQELQEEMRKKEKDPFGIEKTPY